MFANGQLKAAAGFLETASLSSLKDNENWDYYLFFLLDCAAELH
jgi:hypothetical protein